MVLWIIFALMAAAAAFAVLMPFRRPPREMLDRQSDILVYKSQLSEVDRDLTRGIISAEEAEAARIEVSRRLLAVSEGGEERAPKSRTSARLGWGAGAVAVPLVTLGVYLWIGNPNLPGQPLAPRLAAVEESQDFGMLIARVEHRLRQNPEDGRGWEVLAPVYLRLGRVQEAVIAYRNTIRLLGGTPDRYADLGEAIVLVAGGVITTDAKDAFEKAFAIDPEHMKARVFLAMAAEQDAEDEDALERWRAILADTPENAPWRSEVTTRIARLGGGQPEEESGTPGTGDGAVSAPDYYAAGAVPAPDQYAASAVAALPEDERTQMIEGMVSRLDARLRQEGGTVDEWERLIRAHMVLGQLEEASAVLSRARAALQGEPDGIERVDAFAARLGVADPATQ